jgi:hypothetical protein
LRGNTIITTGDGITLMNGCRKYRVNDNIVTPPWDANNPTAYPQHIVSFGEDPGTQAVMRDGGECLRNTVTYAGRNLTTHALFIGDGVRNMECAYNTVNVTSELGAVLKACWNVNFHHNTITAPQPYYLKDWAYNCSATHNTFYSIEPNNAVCQGVVVQKADYTEPNSAFTAWPVTTTIWPLLTGANSHPMHCTVSDNIIVADGSNSVCVRDASNSDDTTFYAHGGNRFDRNIYWCRNGAGLASLQGTAYASGAIATLRTAWNALAADPNNAAFPGLTTVFADNDLYSSEVAPLFRDPNGRDYRLLAGSPAIDPNDPNRVAGAFPAPLPDPNNVLNRDPNDPNTVITFGPGGTQGTGRYWIALTVAQVSSGQRWGRMSDPNDPNSAEHVGTSTNTGGGGGRMIWNP